MSALDRSRPFGVTYGPVAHAYEQDGKLFDGSGWEMGVPRPKEVTVEQEPPEEPVDERDYGDWQHGQLNKLLKQRTGSGAPNGTKKAGLIFMLRELDADGK